MRVAVVALLLGGVLGLGAFVLLRGDEDPGPQPPAAPAPVDGPRRMLVGFQDDPSFRWEPERAENLDRARDAGTTVIRTTVLWHQAAPSRPANPADPFDPAYLLADVDELARNAQQRGIELLLTIWGTPAWANGGGKPNRPPRDLGDLEAFAEALAGRYSGRHAGYPYVRLFSVWNEPNLEQFLAPQFDAAGRSVGPTLYAELFRAARSGIERGNPDALVAIGETSARGKDRPSTDRIQDSHSPAGFARRLSEVRPRVEFDAWAHHPYPTRPDQPPDQRVRWPAVNLTHLDRFGSALDRWFGRDVPLWLTEYGHETLPEEPLGITPALQADYAEQALERARSIPRVEMFVWFVFRDTGRNPWQSGLIRPDGRAKPAFARFGAAARPLDPRDVVVPTDAERAAVPALELAFGTPAGQDVEVRLGDRTLRTPLGRDGRLQVPLDGLARPSTVRLTAVGAGGATIERELVLLG